MPRSHIAGLTTMYRTKSLNKSIQYFYVVKVKRYLVCEVVRKPA